MNIYSYHTLYHSAMHQICQQLYQLDVLAEVEQVESWVGKVLVGINVILLLSIDDGKVQLSKSLSVTVSSLALNVHNVYVTGQNEVVKSSLMTF